MSKSFIDRTIKYYRKRANLKQSELAKKLGITNTDMSFIENKIIIPTKEKAELLSNILEVPIGLLYTTEELDFILYKSKESKKDEKEN